MHGRRRGDPARTFYLLTLVSAACYALSFTLNIVYMATTVGLDAFQLVLVGTVLELSCLVLEVPTGIVADLYSRRLSILIGLTLVGGGLLLQGAVPTFLAILAAQVVWGAGATFTSGAIEAWAADEVGADRMAHTFTRGQQLQLTGSLVGIVGAGALALVHIQLPMIISGLGFLLLAGVLWRIMPEQHFEPVPRQDRETWRRLWATARAGLALARRQRVVRSLLLVSLFVGLSAEAFDRLWQLRLLTGFSVPGLFGAGQPYVWFAAIELVGVTLALACSVAVNKLGLERRAAARPHRVLAVLALLQVGGIAALAWAGWLALALAGVWLKAAATALAAPVISAWMNRNLEPGARATVLSFQSQLGALGEVAGGPPLGLLGRRTSVSIALLGSAVCLLPTVVVLARLRPRRGGEPPPVDPLGLIDQRPHRWDG